VITHPLRVKNNVIPNDAVSAELIKEGGIVVTLYGAHH
jgi:hypothetical protein